MSEVAHSRAEERICAVVVTYRPEPECLMRLLAACRSQVHRLVVVDNGSPDGVLASLRSWRDEDGCALIEQGDNLGVASAQNRGVEWARKQGCGHVILFDQDSVPAPDMVHELFAAWRGLSADGVPVAAVGPVLVDRRTGMRTPFLRIGWSGVRLTGCDAVDDAYLETDFLVSSGMLLSLEALERVGLMEEGLFIDNVDMEWCFRARDMGMRLYGVCDARLEHHLGDEVALLRGRVIHRHGPLRQYYIMRNRITLYRRRYSPVGWVVQDFFRLLFKLVAFSLFFPPRRENLRMMLRGIWDALRGKTGRFPN